MVAYRRPPNLKEKIVRAKIPPVQSRPKRKQHGMKKCPYTCLTCPYVKEIKTIKSTTSKFQHDIEWAVNCQTSNIVYCVSCDKCGEQYVGQSEKTLSIRFGQHRGYVRNKNLDKATGHHFNLPGHSLADMNVSIIEKVHTPDAMMRETRESHFIIFKKKQLSV